MTDVERGSHKAAGSNETGTKASCKPALEEFIF
jgi:hypothetical protein